MDGDVFIADYANSAVKEIQRSQPPHLLRLWL